jgi:serine/threonine protein kinase
VNPIDPSHPPREQLRALVLGLVADAEAARLGSHVWDCAACLESLEQFSAEADPFLSKLRAVHSDPPRGLLTESTVAGPSHEATDPDFAGHLLGPEVPVELSWLAHYRVLRRLGQGGMGMVFEGEDVYLRRRVALKVLKPSLAQDAAARQRFLREAQAAAALRHDHVVTIYQVGEADGPAGRVPFLAMELLEGASLETTLTQRPLALAEAVRIGREVAEGLAAAHKAGLIHRDIKPDNIWLESEPGALATGGRVKLLDFGLARVVPLETHLTERGVVVGTPAYMAPEQAAGQEVDGRADLFSLGCVLYRLCTGRLPFAGGDVMAVLTALATQEPVPVRQLNPAVPPALADLIHRLLARAPAGRPASARQVVALLDGAARQLAETASLPPSRPRPRSWLRVWFPAAALVAVAALVVLAVMVLRPPGAPAELVIDTDDPDLVFRADGKGGVVLEDRKADRRYQLKVGRHDPATGEYEIDVTEPVAGLHFSTRTLTIKRGERVALKASLRPQEKKPKLPAGVTGIDRDWLKLVARLPAAEQVALVTARLKELNPGFDGPVTPKVEKGVVVGLEFPTPKITKLAPVRGLPGLRELKCYAPPGGAGGRLTDLAPLAGLPLRLLRLEGNYLLSDLRPLAGMPLVSLNCYGTPVADLTPLQKCPLERLVIGATRVRNLEAVKGLPLKQLYLNDSAIGDLKPLTGMRLEVLSCPFTPVSDIGPLRGMPLTSVNLHNCQLVKDLAPLRGMPLNDLDIRGVRATDVTPLKDSPLRHLLADEDWLVRHRQFLQALPKLVFLNGKSVRQFWADLDAKKPDKKR